MRVFIVERYMVCVTLSCYVDLLHGSKSRGRLDVVIQTFHAHNSQKTDQRYR